MIAFHNDEEGGKNSIIRAAETWFCFLLLGQLLFVSCCTDGLHIYFQDYNPPLSNEQGGENVAMGP